MRKMHKKETAWQNREAWDAWEAWEVWEAWEAYGSQSRRPTHHISEIWVVDKSNTICT